MTVALTVTRFTPWQSVEDEFSQPDTSTAPSARHAKEKSTLIVTDTALFKIEAAGTHRILFEDIVMAGDRPCRCLPLVDYRGRSIELQADNWKRLKSLKRRLIEILDAPCSTPSHSTQGCQKRFFVTVIRKISRIDFGWRIPRASDALAASSRHDLNGRGFAAEPALTRGRMLSEGSWAFHSIALTAISPERALNAECPSDSRRRPVA